MTGALLSWYGAAKRDLPWRHSSHPYAIWVSEVMLQQTQVAAVLPFFERWMERFPTAEALADANLDDALAMWQGLGYYRRCRLLHRGVRRVVESGGWPTSAKEWRRLPGVGDYSAAALASICLGEAIPVVDGNVERVFARFTACPLTGAARRKAAREWAASQIDPDRPADWNQAIMELGATVCKPRQPLCPACPIRSNCLALRSDQVNRLPVPNPKPPTVDVHWHIVVPVLDGAVGLRQATAAEWWTGMWRFPASDEVGGTGSPVGLVRHTVTRHKISIHVSILVDPEPGSLRWTNQHELPHLAMPSAMRKVWKLAAQYLASPAE